MKTLLFSISLIMVSGLAMARIKIPVCFPCEQVKVVKDLPNEEELKEGMGYLDVGYLYKEYSAVYVPVWNTDGSYVLYSGASQTYYELNAEQLEELQAAYDFELPDNPLSFWQKYGGKIILFLIITFFIYGSIGGDEEEEEEKEELEKDVVQEGV